MGKADITVIMPALNEEKNILDAIEGTMKVFERLAIQGELIVINDGSTDQTEALVNGIMKKDDRIRMIKHESPQGLGVSFWDGVDSAHGDAVVVLPGDNENIPEEILRYCRLLEHVDIVVPFIFNKGARALARSVLSFIYRSIINGTFAVNFNYTNGTILYRRSILRGLDFRSSGFFCQTDILVRLVKKGYLFAEVPYRISARKGGVSKAVSFRSFLRVAGGYLRLVRDIYFTKHKKDEIHFTDDSATALRRRSD